MAPATVKVSPISAFVVLACLGVVSKTVGVALSLSHLYILNIASAWAFVSLLQANKTSSALKAMSLRMELPPVIPVKSNSLITSCVSAFATIILGSLVRTYSFPLR